MMMMMLMMMRVRPLYWMKTPPPTRSTTILRNAVVTRANLTVDSLSLPKLQEANTEGVLGSKSTMFWAPDLDNEANKKFVADFKAKHGTYPSFYAAQSYDSIMLINSAVEATGGNLDDMDGMRAAMEKADFASIRGDFSYGNNHMPVQNFYLREVVTDADGNWTTSITETVFENHVDSYAGECTL